MQAVTLPKRAGYLFVSRLYGEAKMRGLSMNYIRTVVCGLSRQRPLMSNMIKNVYRVPRRYESLDSTKPFDNMPFNVTNRYFCTVVFAFLFGSGLWIPLVLLWYSMAKGSL